MRVRVDAQRCQGQNRCYALAPEVFDVDDLGQALVIATGSIPQSLEARVRLAAANCPERAITVSDDD
ncbi:MAG: ferredoxin [Acidimicrobiia bacterium]|nr:ferredoxin [Acidimicrobiia bacterium]